MTKISLEGIFGYFQCVVLSMKGFYSTCRWRKTVKVCLTGNPQCCQFKTAEIVISMQYPLKYCTLKLSTHFFLISCERVLANKKKLVRNEGSYRKDIKENFNSFDL